MSTNLHAQPVLNTFGESFHTAFSLLLQANPVLLETIGLSLMVSCTACLMAAVIGMVAGAWLSVARFPGHQALLAVVNTSLALPSVVVGLFVYLMLSRSGPLGSWGILFTPAAMIIAQTILLLPIVTALTRQVIADGLREARLPLRSMGAGRMTGAALMLVHERWAVLTITLTAFGRAISEVGAVMIVGGNIEGFTRVITTSIALETSKGDLPLALALGLVLLSIVAAINIAIMLAQRLQQPLSRRAR